MPHLGQTSLLKTAIATVCTDYICCEANILFDEGAQRSFITRTLANQMGLETSEIESIHLSAFGGQASAVRHLPLVTLKVVTTSGEKISLRILVVEKIATPLQTHLQQGVEHLPHLRGLKLAHLITSDESFDVSLLIVQIITGILLKTMLSVDLDQQPSLQNLATSFQDQCPHPQAPLQLLL